MSAFHAGEIEVQRQAGVRNEAERVGRIIGASIPEGLDALLAVQRLAVAATVDSGGRPWASLLTGPEGFIARADEQLLRLTPSSGMDETMRGNLGAHADLGLLVIDLATRRRVRFNGRGLSRPKGLFLLVDQVYGNCQKYIRRRRVVSTSEVEHASVRRLVRRAGSLAPHQQALVAGADTFFLATWDPEGGADASHRGGAAGFVGVPDGQHIEFPDYPGNNMFNSLGNIARHPRAGLLFVDFDSGDLVQVTGRARLEGSGSRALRIEIEEVRETPGGAGLRFAPLEPSPG